MLLLAALSAQARERVEIVGSSTVAPFVERVIDRVARKDGTSAVKRTTGTGGGFKLFCAGTGGDTPDITGASRPISDEELKTCAANGVTAIGELEIGLDGIVVAAAVDSPHPGLTRSQLFQALAAEVEKDGEVVANPFRRLNEIDPALPDVEIEVMGPPSTSGTRDALIDLVMLPGCAASPAIAALPEEARARVCTSLRSDGRFIAAGEDDQAIVGELRRDPGLIGLFGSSFVVENEDRIAASPVEGVVPDDTSIASGASPLRRPFFLHVKLAPARTVGGVVPFLAAFTSEAAIGPDGYLVDAGLVAPPDAEREATRAAARSSTAMRRTPGS